MWNKRKEVTVLQKNTRPHILLSIHEKRRQNNAKFGKMPKDTKDP